MRSRVLIVCTAALAACTDLSAVNNFANMRTSLPQVKTVASQFPATLDLQLAWASSDDERTRMQAQLATRANDTKVAIAGIQALNDYMAALGALASDAAPTQAQTDATTISNQLATLKPDGRDVITAAGSLIGKLLQSGLDAYRGKRVADVIVQYNLDLQSLTERLALFCNDVAAGYHSADTDLHTFYSPANAKLRTRAGSFESVMLSGSELNLRQNILAGKEDAANQAAGVLRDIGQAHQKLADNASKLSAAQLQADIQTLSTDVSAATTLISKLK
jgi:hypothetical protein